MPTITEPTTVGAPRFSGLRLHSARRAAGLTRTQLGAQVGRSRESIRAYEELLNPPSANVIGALAHVLGVSIDALYAAPGELATAPEVSR